MEDRLTMLKQPESKIIRVFPRKTNATPNDNYSFIGYPPDNLSGESLEQLRSNISQIHFSTLFTYDIDEEKRIISAWHDLNITTDLRSGGPAHNAYGGEFIPGMYVKHIMEEI